MRLIIIGQNGQSAANSPTFAEANTSAERDAVHRLNVGGFPIACGELSRPMQWEA
jgi:hypothetical protein